MEWCRFGERRWHEAFFTQTVRAACEEGCPLRVTPAEVLDDWADAAPELPLAGLIFHLSRCGSTLVSRMLAALPENRVLSEAETLGGVLDAEIGDERRARWLRGLLHAYATRRAPEERRLIIKLDPWQTLDADLIRAAFPGVPTVFVYRDPVEVLMSLSDNVAVTFAPTPVGAVKVGMTFLEALSVSSEEYCARAVGHIAAAAATQRGASWRLVEYTQLPDAVETEIAPLFGLTLDAEARVALRSVTPFHAKAQGRLVFRPDSARKQRDADGWLRDLAQRWIVPAYGELEEQRLLHSAGWRA